MADPSGDGCPHSSRLDDAATADRRCNLNAVTASRPTCLHNHYHQQQRTTTALTVVGFDDPPNADEHPESSEKLALGFILNNGASTGTAADRAPASAARGVDAVSLMGLNCDHDQLQLQQQPYMPSSSVESSRRARVRSYSSDDRRGRVSSIAGHRMTNSVVSRPRTARIDYDSSPLSVSSLIQDMQVSSPATAGHRGASAPAAKRGTAEQSKLEKKRGRMCKTEGCENYIVHKGLCCRHGGGKKCLLEGCNTSAKHMGLCWKHGGSMECDIDGCTKRAKARRLCWAHGGGTKCVNVDCEKVAVSGGCCWAHGGGKRCNFDDCNKPAYERTQNFCVKHHTEMQHINYFEV